MLSFPEMFWRQNVPKEPSDSANENVSILHHKEAASTVRTRMFASRLSCNSTPHSIGTLSRSRPRPVLYASDGDLFVLAASCLDFASGDSSKAFTTLAAYPFRNRKVRLVCGEELTRVPGCISQQPASHAASEDFVIPTAMTL